MKSLRLKPLLKPVVASVDIPGSKSYTNRALLLAALVDSEVKISNPLFSDDTKAFVSCLKILGLDIVEKKNSIEVINSIASVKGEDFVLDCNESGTTIRFLTALCCNIPGVKVLKGKDSLNKRPIADLVNALRQLGAEIEYAGKEGYPPIKITSSKLLPGTIKIRGSISSQFISSLLMVTPLVGDVTIKVIGEQISKPYIDMTIDTMKKFGVDVLNDGYRRYTFKKNCKYLTKEFVIEGDLSSAGYFAAIAALTKSTITLKNINQFSKQADMKFIKILKDMGNQVSYGKDEVKVVGKGIMSVNADMQDCPDQVQTLAVLVAFADGVSKISGISSLRIKETDRVLALRQELAKMGIKTSATKHVLTIYGGNPKAATIKTYGDHRMVMSFAVAGAKLSGMQITDPDVVNKTFPDFWKTLNSIGSKNQNYKNIVLIGMRGSGKTSIAKILSKKLGRKYLDFDEMVVKKMKMDIAQIVKKYGWDFFRDKESEIVKVAAVSQGLVISTGGGIVTRLENIKTLRKNGLLIFLDASLGSLEKRIGQKIGHDPKMPALTAKKSAAEELREILKQRHKKYKEAADIIIATDNLSLLEITDKIILKMKEASL